MGIIEDNEIQETLTPAKLLHEKTKLDGIVTSVEAADTSRLSGGLVRRLHQQIARSYFEIGETFFQQEEWQHAKTSLIVAIRYLETNAAPSASVNLLDGPSRAVLQSDGSEQEPPPEWRGAACRMLAQIWQHEGRSDLAEECLQKWSCLLLQRPRTRGQLVHLGDCYRQLGEVLLANPEATPQMLSQAAGLFRNALHAYMEASYSEKDAAHSGPKLTEHQWVYTRFFLARALYQNREYDQARFHFQFCLEQFPDFLAAHCTIKVTVLYHLAKTHLQSKAFAEAIALLQATIALVQSDPVPDLHLIGKCELLIGDVYQLIGQKRLAQATYVAAIQSAERRFGYRSVWTELNVDRIRRLQAGQGAHVE